METQSAKMYDRWDIHQRAQHWLIVISFTMLAVTGILIKFAYTSWAQSITKSLGGFEIIFGIHLVGAVIMAASAVYHLFYLIFRAAKGKLRGSMFPQIKDITDFFANISYFLGFGKEAPKFHKYSYKEKVDYLAEYWGTPLMLITGLILLYPGKSAEIMPRWVIEGAHFAHQGEGMLAILVIFTWHFFAVHFSPDFFPMNKVWLTGKVSREVMEHEYPLELARIEEAEGVMPGTNATHAAVKTQNRILLISELIIYGLILVGVLWYFLPQALS